MENKTQTAGKTATESIGVTEMQKTANEAMTLLFDRNIEELKKEHETTGFYFDGCGNICRNRDDRKNSDDIVVELSRDEVEDLISQGFLQEKIVGRSNNTQ